MKTKAEITTPGTSEDHLQVAVSLVATDETSVFPEKLLSCEAFVANRVSLKRII